MSNSCESCDRSFVDNHSLQQHLRDSPVHKPHFSSDEAPQQHRRDSVVPIPIFSCETCNKSFGSNQALQQHLRDSIIHKINHNCETCRRSFSSDDALQQHLQNSPVHNLTVDCVTCDISFSSDEALQEHLRDSIVHNPTFDCATCEESFSNEEDLNQHIQTSLVHSRLSFWCDTCERPFRSDEALQQHLQSSRIHQNERQQETFFMLPNLHQDVLDAVSGTMDPPKFNKTNSFHRINNKHESTLMGKFECKNHRSPLFWTSGVIAIIIRGYPGNEYNAGVFNQRCKFCNGLGTLHANGSYVERVAYRLKKWAGVSMVPPPYKNKNGPPHKSELCEGCKAGCCLERYKR
jgi:hypothetical protein